jgi:hypothetical protein
MAIDPKLYEKYSGRSGDPYKRMGEALAQGAARKQSVQASKGDAFSTRYIEGAIKWRWWMSVVGAIIVAIVALTSFWR